MLVASLKGKVRNALRGFGMDLIRYVPDPVKEIPVDMDKLAVATIVRVTPYTMTSVERIYSLIQAIRYISSAGVAGDVVECGVWRGGSMMAAALTLLECEDADRDLYLFDTFEGMSDPTAKDVAVDGRTADELLVAGDRMDPNSVWCYSTIEEVHKALATIRYKASRLHFVKGKVEDTIPAQAPERIALLRLDTDWYESTRHELEHLYPRLVPGGVLIIDDYGHWAGCRQAVDEYIASHKVRVLLNRVDYTGRIAIKGG